MALVLLQPVGTDRRMRADLEAACWAMSASLNASVEALIFTCTRYSHDQIMPWGISVETLNMQPVQARTQVLQWKCIPSAC